MNNFIEIGSSTVIRVNVRLVLQEEKTLNAGAWEPWLQVHSCDLDVQATAAAEWLTGMPRNRQHRQS